MFNLRSPSKSEVEQLVTIIHERENQIAAGISKTSHLKLLTYQVSSCEYRVIYNGELEDKGSEYRLADLLKLYVEL